MKTNSIIFVLFVAMVLLGYTSCASYSVDESLLADKTSGKAPEGQIIDKNTELTIGVARQWYDANNNPVVELRVTKGKAGAPVKPWWERAIERKRGIYEVVETPLRTQHSSVMMDSETIERVHRGEADSTKIRNIARMVILKNLKRGYIRSFIIVFIGSYDYLMTSKTFGNNSYLYREPDFDGRILFFEPDKGLLNGWIYRNGKIKRQIYPDTIPGVCTEPSPMTVIESK